jgi:hypothetical protein
MTDQATLLTFLEIKKKVQEIKELYNNDSGQDSFNLLLLGESGTGKSFILRTARKPVHIDSFDPGGTKCLRPEIAKGDIIADTRWENDDPFKPSVWRDWVKETQSRMKDGYFNHLGTYVIDSSTKWADAIMNNILMKAGIPGEPPRFTKDYNPQKVQILNWVKYMLRVPCDFIMTGHLEAHKDEVSGAITYRYMSTGKAVALIPLEFDEIWVTDTKPRASGPEYLLITAHTNRHLASSRIGRGCFEPFEKPDIKYLLEKAKLPTQDKPKLLGD